MRTLAFLSLALTLCSAKKAGAQPLAEGNFFTGVQLINITTGKKARQPMMYIWEQQSVKLDKYLVLGADITLTKNTVPYSQEQGKVLEFYQLNLIQEWAMSEPMDFIFCRNVMIYFDKKTRVKLVERYANNLCDGGYLFIGHSESLFNLTDRFELIGNTIYRKRG